MACDYARVMRFLTKKPNRIYLDYAAATPLHPSVFREMKPFLTEHFGNPSAVHAEGRKAREAIEDARAKLARILRVRTTDVTFTGSGTESNNIAIRGFVAALRESGRAYENMEIITTTIEHPSVLETVRALATEGVRVTYAPVLADDGRIDVSALSKLLSKKTVLVTFSYVNSEIGVVQPVKKITRLIRKFNTDSNTTIKTHLDASQAPLWLPCQPDMLGVDMLTLDAGKCYGPKGVGVLLHLQSVPLRPIMYGGGQEHALRPSTESAALIVGATAALVRAERGRDARVSKVTALREQFFALLEEEIPGAIINGSREHRVANNVHISLPGFESEYAVVVLDTAGIAASTRSACGSGETAGSYVVREIGGELRARATLRFTLGEETTFDEVRKAVASLKTHLQSMSMYSTLPEGSLLG